MANGEGNQKTEKAVVLVSGGMDSATLLHFVKKRLDVAVIFAISFMYGQKHERELQMAKRQLQAVAAHDHRIVDLSEFGALAVSALTDAEQAVPDLVELDDDERRQPCTYVPNRNMVFLSIAVAYAESIGAEKVFYGAQAQDEYGYWDCTVDFIAKMNDVLGLNRATPVRVCAPFVEKRKSEVLRIGLELGVDYAHTWTCYRGGVAPCGGCPSCVERASAFREVGVDDELLL